MNNFQAVGKFLDQPLLVSKFQENVPLILGTLGTLYTAKEVYNAPDDKKKDTFIKTGLTMGATVVSAVYAPKIASAFAKKDPPPKSSEIIEKNTGLIDEFIKTNNPIEPVQKILEKGKNKILNIGEIKDIFEKLGKEEKGKNFLEEFIPSPKNTTAEDIFDDIKYLSIYGAVPVAGGIAGGVAADVATDKKHWKEKFPNKIKEGSYQYLANIFMCNIGAGAALHLMEKKGVTSKTTRALGMIAGIVLTGVIGGSKIANFIGKHIIDPIFDKKEKEKPNYDIKDYVQSAKNKKEYKKEIKKQKEKERTPELIDIGLHTDDIATVSLLSGLKWIEPALPLLYSVSGYRAGIGYRN